MTSTATAAPATSYQGTDKLLFGLVLAVVTFWLFAGTTGTVAPAIMEDIGPRFIDAASMNLAVSITALFSGLFIVLTGGLADRVGRVKITLIGVALGVVGLPAARLRGRRIGFAVAACRARNPGLLRGVHHASIDGAGEGVLGWTGSATRRFYVVDRLVGWLGPGRCIRRRYDTVHQLAGDLHRVHRGLGYLVPDDLGHAREQG
jgi:hypothetical protein